MDTLWHDVRFGARELLRHPGFAIVAILTLALGIGANSAVFTMVDALLFRPIDAARPDRVVWVTQRAGDRAHYQQMSYLDFRSYRDQASQLASVAAFGRTSLALGGAAAARVNGQLVSANYLDLLGVKPLLGRAFVAAEDSAGSAPVAIMSYALWSSRFGADSSVIGRPIIINGKSFIAIGVTPQGFAGIGIGESADLFLPLPTQPIAMPSDQSLLTSRDAGWLRVVGRLRDGATVASANADIARIGLTLHEGRTEPNLAAVLPVRGGLDPGNRSEALPIMSLIMIVPVLVLLVACANVANMLLARGMARRKELAVRRALGGGRGRIVRQLLTESLMLAAAAGVVGVTFAFWLISLIVKLGNVPVDFAGILTPDLRVVLFTAVVAGATTIVFGLLPALSATSPSLTPALKQESAAHAFGRTRHRLRDVFVVSQLALSLLLLVTAGLFLRSLGKALQVAPGFDPRNRVSASFDLELQGYSADAREQFYADAISRATAIPGVESAAITNALPLNGRLYGNMLIAEGVADEDHGAVEVGFYTTTPGYFGTLDIPLLKGRDFGRGDRSGAPPVAVINATLARRLWGAENPIGKRVRLAGRDEPFREVVGVVRDGKYESLTESPRNAIFLPATQYRDAGSEVTLVVRSQLSDAAALTATTQLLKEMDTNLPLSATSTLSDMLHRNADKQQAAAALLGVFGALALLLAALGIYGVMAHGVALRTREIGIRMALGAHRSHVLSLFIGDGARLAAVGTVIGLLLSLGVSRLLNSMLFGLTATDLATFAGGAVVLALTTIIASYLPARRAARVDPVIAMRAE